MLQKRRSLNRDGKTRSSLLWCFSNNVHLLPYDDKEASVNNSDESRSDMSIYMS